MPRPPKKKIEEKKSLIAEMPEPVMASVSTGMEKSIASCAREAATGTRRNRASTITRTDRYKNIEEGLSPYVRGSGSGKYSSNISCRDAIILCQKAYWNVPIFRSTIDLMTEFSVSPIYFTGGNKQSRAFFEAWIKKINIWGLEDQWFREYYRSGNVVLYKLKAVFDDEAKKKFQQSLAVIDAEIPLKYIVLNPADIAAGGTVVFGATNYFKVLNEFEISVLLNPLTEQDREIAESIPELQELKGKKKTFGNQVLLPLDPLRIVVTFYKKQDYEPLAVPMGFPVLEDINAKLELKKIDIGIARTAQQAVLLITMGSEESGVSAKNINAMQSLFQNESVSRVLVADFTTKATWCIPQIGDLLNPEKYEILDRDIRLGLNSVLFGEEKFSNTSIKVEVFLARLKHSREAFMQFLKSEMNAIGKAMKFDKIPTPNFYDNDFKDDALRGRLYAQLIQYGTLTAEEGIEAIQTGRLPTPEESRISQEEFLKMREKMMYQPVTSPMTQENGRPPGTGTPQTTKKVSPIGKGPQSKAFLYSQSKLKDTILASNKLYDEIKKSLKTKYKAKKLSKDQNSIAEDIGEVIMANEQMASWNNAVDKYIETPIGENTQQQSEIDSIAAEMGTHPYLATLLYHSKKEE